MCSGTLFTVEKNLPRGGLKLGTARSVGQHLTRSATVAPSPFIIHTNVLFIRDMLAVAN